MGAAEPEVFWAFNAMYGLELRLSRSAFFRDSFERIFRADLTLSEGYDHPSTHLGSVPKRLAGVISGPSTTLPLSCGITAMGASGDPMVPETALAGWSEHTTSSFELQWFPGGHTFFLESAGQAAFADCVRTTLLQIQQQQQIQQQPPLHQEEEIVNDGLSQNAVVSTRQVEGQMAAGVGRPQGTSSAGVLASKVWCVVGNLEHNPIVTRLVDKLKDAGQCSS